jgi:hypothetical protein
MIFQPNTFRLDFNWIRNPYQKTAAIEQRSDGVMDGGPSASMELESGLHS